MKPRQVRAAIRDTESADAPRRPHSAVFVTLALAGGVALGLGLHWLLALPTSSPAAPAAEAAALHAAAGPAVAAPVEAPLDEHPALSPEQLARLAGYSSAGQRLLTERLAATTELLARAPDRHYAIELFDTTNTDQARMERFLMRARDMVPLDKVFVVPVVEKAGRYRLRVLYGEFESLQAALEAERALPPKYQRAFQTSLHSFAELREQL